MRISIKGLLFAASVAGMVGAMGIGAPLAESGSTSAAPADCDTLKTSDPAAYEAQCHQRKPGPTITNSLSTPGGAPYTPCQPVAGILPAHMPAWSEIQVAMPDPCHHPV